MVLKKRCESDDQKIVAFFFRLIKASNGACPFIHSQKHFKFFESRLITLASHNKVFPWLFHFLDCARCKGVFGEELLRMLHAIRIDSSAKKILFQNEKIKIASDLKSLNISAITLKDFTLYNKIAFHQNFQVGYDIDIFTKSNNIKLLEKYFKQNNYEIEKKVTLQSTRGTTHFEEKHLLNRKKRITVDLHYDIAIPINHPSGFLDKRVLDDIKYQLSAEIEKTESGLVSISKEWFLLILIIHFICNDMLKGLRSFYEIIYFAKQYESDIDWSLFISLTQLYKIKKATYFIFLAGSKIFNITTEPILSNNKPSFFLQCIYSRIITPSQFAVFFSRFDAQDNINHHKKIMKEMRDFYFLIYFLADNTTDLRLLRPQLILSVIRKSLSNY